MLRQWRVDHSVRQVFTIGTLAPFDVSKVRFAQAHIGINVGATERQPLEVDVFDAGVIRRYPCNLLQGVNHRVCRFGQQLFDLSQITRQTGVHGASERLAQIELKVAVEVDKISQTQVHIWQRNGAQDNGTNAGCPANRQVQALDKVQSILKEASADFLWDQVHQSLETNGQQTCRRLNVRQVKPEVG